MLNRQGVNFGQGSKLKAKAISMVFRRDPSKQKPLQMGYPVRHPWFKGAITEASIGFSGLALRDQIDVQSYKALFKMPAEESHRIKKRWTAQIS